jgi:hypothetical protein
MFDIAEDIQPIILTINGKAPAVVAFKQREAR